MGEAYNIYMSWNNNAEKLYLPVMPEKIEVQRKGRGKTYDIIGLGQINSIQSRELAEISFESFFPNPKNFQLPLNPQQYYPFLSSEVLSARSFFEPKWYVSFIQKWQDSKHPIKFIFQSRDYTLNWVASIEQFDRWEEAGSEGDIGYRLTVKEYVFHTARKVTVTKDKAGNTVLKKEQPKRPDLRVKPETVVVQPGDTLMGIARRWFDDSGLWRELRALNKLTADQVKVLPVGLVLKLPKKG